VTNRPPNSCIQPTRYRARLMRALGVQRRLPIDHTDQHFTAAITEQLDHVAGP
jgi:hypothetical protein